jgi:two-component system sensor histidine kinase KdpD
VIDATVEGGTVAVRVTDDGPGILPDVLPHVFEKFIHARSGAESLADGGDGSGLGLTIAKGIMEAHGGTVAAQSPVGKGHGTRIVFTFPSGEEPK